MLFTSVVICVIILIVLCYCFLEIKRFILNFIQLNKLPGDPRSYDLITGSLPMFGITAESFFKKLREWNKRYYPIYQVSVFHVITVHMLKPEDFELVLSNSKHNKKSLIYSLLHNWLKTGLLTSGGKKWQTRRRILTPAFHFNILQNFIAIFNEQTDKMVEILQKECHKPFIPVHSHISQFTLATIVETAMGTNLHSEKGKKYKQAIFDIGQVYFYRFMHTWFVIKVFNFFSPKFFEEKKLVKSLHEFTEEVIEERKKTFKEIVLPENDDEIYTEKIRLAMLDLLLKAKEKDGLIDDEGIREEVNTFTFEGHDTTAAALSFALMLLACNKNVQELIVQEMTNILVDLHKKPTYNDLQEMKYLERVIKEVLRLYPSVFFISRQIGEELVTSTGYILPKNTPVALHIYDLHHNPDIYPDPEKFDPDRFLPEYCQKRHPFAYVPFSAGPRNCIGQRFAMLEMKDALCGILANFVLEPVDTPSTIVLVVDIILRTKEDVKVKFIPRPK